MQLPLWTLAEFLLPVERDDDRWPHRSGLAR